MKKFMLLVTGVMMAVALAACTPTQQAKETRTAPEGVTQESIDGAADKLNSVNTDPSVTVCIYSVKEDQSGLKQNMDSLEGATELDAQLLLDRMSSLGVIEEGITVTKFEQNDKALTLDLSSLEKSGDKQIITAIANTFLQNYDLKDDGKLNLSVNGTAVSEDALSFDKEYKTLK